MGTESKIVEELRSKVEKYLRQKQLSYEVKSGGTLWVRQGSTVVVVAPMQWGENEQTLVKLSAPVSLEIKKISPELTRFLAEKTINYCLGNFPLM